MTRSMTAFARAEGDVDGNRMTWEIRSVNHRYLDIHLRLPEEWRYLEPDCREAISAKVGRGRVDAQLKLERPEGAAGEIVLDEDALANISQAMTMLEARMPGLRPARTTDLLRWPGVIRETSPDPETTRRTCLGVLAGALRTLRENRDREGAGLDAVIRERAGLCRDCIRRLDDGAPQIQQQQQEKLLARVRDLGVEVEPERLAREVALLVARGDVREELDRMHAHLDEIHRLLESDQPVGRSLDFLMQELNREANTLGAKSIDPDMSGAAVDLKVLVEQMREQVQNIE